MARGERSVSDLRQSAERSRMELTGTVDQLRSRVSDQVADFRDRVSPENIKAEVGDYFRSRGELLLDKARENPLQTAAIGAALAYPLMGVIKAIPAPVLMIGAGVFFLGSAPGQKFSRKVGTAANDLFETASDQIDAAARNIRDAQDGASQVLASVTSSAATTFDRLKSQSAASAAALSSGLDDLEDRAGGVAASVSNTVDNLTGVAADAANATSTTIRQGLASASAGVKQASDTAVDFGTDAANNVRQRATETSRQVTATFVETLQQNPLVVGGIGLAVGMLLASALPRSDLETGLMGAASADLKESVGDAASQGYESAKEFASGVMGDVTQRANEVGLNPNGLHNAAEDLGRRVRKIAENAATTALELPTHSTTDAA
jgi:ElaB/YqjD/DUF883 family membrane-anchored ribosome-binding protein